jgi:hypothetical protein|tara:strand:- start:56 stop:325 length:270 start_codon:yes stop_codon:yes gene_type:complete
MATYPGLSNYTKITTVQQLEDIVRTFVNELTRELDLEDQKQTNAPATKIYTVTTVTEIGRPSAGAVAYSTSSGKFRGYTTTATAWVDFN